MKRWLKTMVVALAWLGAGGGFLLGLAVSLGLVSLPGQPSLAALLAPFVAVILVGCVLL
jgi:hypothetical protein